MAPAGYRRALALALALAVALAAAWGAACVDEESREVAGKDLYLRYCASCHGAGGRGDGPVGDSLKRPPSDLTTLARRSGGRFDEAALMAAIDGRRVVAEHGSREMPVWGAVFESEHRGEPFQAYVGLLETRSLVDYLRSIQRK
jgi:mono/diheme cytochrome c family protein